MTISRRESSRDVIRPRILLGEYGGSTRRADICAEFSRFPKIGEYFTMSWLLGRMEFYSYFRFLTANTPPKSRRKRQSVGADTEDLRCCR
jgi:hypothetical protein